MVVDLSAARRRLGKIVEEWPPDALPDLLGELARVTAVATLRLHENGAAPAPPTNKLGRHLTADEVAERLGVSTKWCYDHADELGAVRLSGRAVRFPEMAIYSYIAARTGR